MSNALTNELCRRLGIRLPIFGLAHHIEVAAAISRAGGLGVYAAARDGPQELQKKLRQLRELCPDHPVGVDLLLPTGLPEHDDRAAVAAALPQGHRDFVQGLFRQYDVPPATEGNFFSQYVRSQSLFEEQVDAIADSDIEVFAAGVGTPVKALARIKARGLHTIALVGSVRHAQKAIAAGADILVAQGYDAGGHTGPVGTFTLVPQIVAAAQGRPVIAAGGMCCSLGYMVAARATEVVANRSAIVGSIGVIASVTDYTEYLGRLGIRMEYFTNESAKYKAAGAIGTSLTDDQRQNIKAGIESAFLLFKTTVTGKRPGVKEDAMQGQTFRGTEAKAAGLVDRIGDESFALSVLRNKIKA